MNKTILWQDAAIPAAAWLTPVALMQSDYAICVDNEYTLDARERVKDISTFSPCHINHSAYRKNVVRKPLRDQLQIHFFASKDIYVRTFFVSAWCILPVFATSICKVDCLVLDWHETVCVATVSGMQQLSPSSNCFKIALCICAKHRSVCVA